MEQSGSHDQPHSPLAAQTTTPDGDGVGIGDGVGLGAGGSGVTAGGIVSDEGGGVTASVGEGVGL